MTRSRQTWLLERNAPVRADAEGLFVPAVDLPDAFIGDAVLVQSHEGSEHRVGTIAARTELDEQQFFRLDLTD